MASSDFSDPEFLNRLKARDSSALENLVNEYLPQLIRACRGMGFTMEECEDLAQSVFLALIEGLSRFEGRSHIRTFIFGIFYHKVSEHIRFKRHQPDPEDIDSVVKSRFAGSGCWARPPADLERQVLSQEIGSVIRDCLDKVPPAQRSAFVLREVEGMGTADICNILQISATHLGVLLFRARNRLRECVERRGLARG
jgi:RNA polymerase sigma-70 factor (ECF subfamily)